MVTEANPDARAVSPLNPEPVGRVFDYYREFSEGGGVLEGIFSCMFCKFLRDANIIDPVRVTTAKADLVFQAVTKPKGMMSFKSQMTLEHLKMALLDLADLKFGRSPYEDPGLGVSKLIGRHLIPLSKKLEQVDVEWPDPDARALKMLDEFSIELGFLFNYYKELENEPEEDALPDAGITGEGDMIRLIVSLLVSLSI